MVSTVVLAALLPTVVVCAVVADAAAHHDARAVIPGHVDAAAETSGGVDGDAQLVAGERALAALAFEDAALLFETATASPHASPRERARAWLGLAQARGALLDEAGAQAAFAAALVLDNTVALPEGTSPKVSVMFLRTRAALAAGLVPVEGDGCEADRVQAQQAQRMQAPTVPARSSLAPYVVAAGNGVVAVVAGGAALGLEAALARPTAGRTRAQYEALRAAELATAALAVAGGAAAVTALALGAWVAAAQWSEP